MAYSNYKTPYYEDEATFSSQSLNKIQEMEPVEKLQYIDELSNKMDTLKESIKQHEAQKAEQVKAQAEAVQQTQNETTPSE
jgi:prephenate dehydrogenase